MAYSASASGTCLSQELFPKLGVADRMKVTAKKIMSERLGAVVAHGEAELGFQQACELPSASCSGQARWGNSVFHLIPTMMAVIAACAVVGGLTSWSEIGISLFVLLLFPLSLSPSVLE